MVDRTVGSQKSLFKLMQLLSENKSPSITCIMYVFIEHSPSNSSLPKSFLFPSAVLHLPESISAGFPRPECSHQPGRVLRCLPFSFLYPRGLGYPNQYGYPEPFPPYVPTSWPEPNLFLAFSLVYLKTFSSSLRFLDDSDLMFFAPEFLILKKGTCILIRNKPSEQINTK